LPRGRGSPYNGLYGKAPPKRDIFFRLQIYKRVGSVGDESVTLKHELCVTMKYELLEHELLEHLEQKMVYKRVRGWTLGQSLPI